MKEQESRRRAFEVWLTEQTVLVDGAVLAGFWRKVLVSCKGNKRCQVEVRKRRQTGRRLESRQ